MRRVEKIMLETPKLIICVKLK